jgi:trk system potassium uptake protein TrkH
LKAWSQVLHPMFALAAVVCLLALVGWTENITGWEHHCTIIIGLAFAIERIAAFLRLDPLDDSKRRLGYQRLLGLAVLGVSVKLLLDGSVAVSKQGMLGWHVLVLGSVLVSGLVSMIYHQTRFTARAFHPGWVLIGSFVFIIAVGALLLKMPRCVVRVADLTWLEAIFTSTSAVSLTGLAVENTATTFSLTGQCVILLLIQIGGLGIMTLTFFAAIVLFEGLSLHDRLLLGKMIQDNRLARIGRTLGFIVGMTFMSEAVGAAVLFVGMDVVPDWQTRLFHSVFHSVSAFCNAASRR